MSYPVSSQRLTTHARALAFSMALLLNPLTAAAQENAAADGVNAPQPGVETPTADAASPDAGAPEAAPADGLAPVPEPPEIPQAVQSGEALEPDVTIIQREQETVQEYRLNGQLYMIKIIPSSGPPYYLIDNDGNGSLETRGNDIVSESNIPQWVLFSWK
ncbi:MAG TPA: DUF2782 domain-containing protein [Gammaproteobacteria bacterium]|nr:DUF2782 domain-containing protein [Gammaproteobacteria bacterium]